LGLVVLATIVLLFKEFLVISFDPVLAATIRLPAERLRNLMLVLIALTIVVSMQTVGVGLVAAMLVTPGATAYLLTRRLPTMMVIAAIIGAFSSIAGLYLSFYVNVASGAAVVLIATIIFLLVFLFTPAHGIVWRYLPGLKRIEPA
ncbi:MAG: metal ABC transporter permease, partial [Chloroflexota bacterium]|nr:metal ABC transporter permease [Chloroflexota bacterium]